MNNIHSLSSPSLPERVGLIKAGKFTGRWCELTFDHAGGWSLVILSCDPRTKVKESEKSMLENVIHSDYFPSHDALHYFMRDEVPEVAWQ